MIVMETKEDLIKFFELITKEFKDNLTESGFEVNLSIIPVDRNNLKGIYKTFQKYQQSKENMVQPVTSAPPNTTKKPQN